MVGLEAAPSQVLSELAIRAGVDELRLGQCWIERGGGERGQRRLHVDVGAIHWSRFGIAGARQRERGIEDAGHGRPEAQSQALGVRERGPAIEHEILDGRIVGAALSA